MNGLRRMLGVLLIVAGQAALAAAEEAHGVAPATTEEPVVTAAANEPTDMSAPDAGPPEPFEFARSLNALQNQLAIGSEAALTAQRTVLIRLGDQMLATDRDAWAEPANARAAIAYVLSGGRPELLRVLLEDKALPEARVELAKAVLAYATGRRAEALAGLRQVDARALAPLLGAHVALAQGTLAMQADPERAAGYLETARLLAPGTIVEESALRRQITVASAHSDADSFIFLTRQYMRRYPHSIYAARFLRAFPELWSGLGLSDDPDVFARLTATLSGLEATARRGVYLSLARRNVLAGDRELARFAAERAAELSDSDGRAALRAELYAAAASVAGPDGAPAWRTLQSIDPSLLSGIDAEIHSAALAVATQVQEPAGPERDAEGATADPEPSPVVAEARASLAAADALLRRIR